MLIADWKDLEREAFEQFSIQKSAIRIFTPIEVRRGEASSFQLPASSFQL
jgi:hypothetical protein